MIIEIIPWNPGMEPEAEKCYCGMPNHVYHGLKDWFGSSMLKHILRSVESFHYEMTQPHKDSIALERGSALHVAIEGLATDGKLDLFVENIVECPTKTINSKAWQELKSDNPEKSILPEAEIENVREMAEKLYRKASEINFFSEGWPELSFFWIDEETGLKLKCRPDWLKVVDGYIQLDDYKTSKNHQKETFEKDVVNYSYHLSAALYSEGVRRVTGFLVESFSHFVIANTPPFEVEYYGLDRPSLEEGYALFKYVLREIVNYEPEAKLEKKTISIPFWGFRLTERPWNG